MPGVMFVCANVAYVANVLTNGPATRSLSAYVWLLPFRDVFHEVSTAIVAIF